MRITINNNTTFLISDELGNIPAKTEFGIYHEDTRFLCEYELLLDGQLPLLLAAQATDADAATHFLANPVLAHVPRGQLSVIRRRHIEQGLREEIEITNYGQQDAPFTLELRYDADFVHLFEVKHEVEVSKDGQTREGTYTQRIDADQATVRFLYTRGNFRRQLRIAFSQHGALSDNSCRFALSLAPREVWRLTVDFHPLADEISGAGVLLGNAVTAEGYVAARTQHRAEFLRHAPHLWTDSQALQRAYDQSVRDYAALQIEGEGRLAGEFIIAAGIPWFMTLFGRDSLIAAYQVLSFYPEAARGVLRALARMQGTHVDRLRAEEPGKILHEYRSEVFIGTQKSAAVFPYYGTVDATPLFLMLLADVYKVTGDRDFVSSLRGNALHALEWMERYGDRDGDGYLEYLREADAGLENQGWKDSGDSVRFRDGRQAQAPIALCEVQGYAYAARMGMAEVFDALGEPERATHLRADAAKLKERFNRDFWLPERGTYALALDAKKQQVDALTSNPGHLLWTGIADEEKAHQVVQHLLAPELFSGWGVRTMATREGAYNPNSYHNGSVWPHDNSLIVAGLARYGYIAEATRIVDALITALSYYPDHRLPELFAGYSREDAPFPVEYPTASRPQAWAAGTVFLLLSVMTGLDVNARADGEQAFLPASVHQISLEGMWVDGKRVDIELSQSRQGIVAYALHEHAAKYAI